MPRTSLPRLLIIVLLNLKWFAHDCVLGSVDSRGAASDLNLPWPSELPEKFPRVISWKELQNQLRAPYASEAARRVPGKGPLPFVEIASARQFNGKPTDASGPPQPPVL